MKPYSHTEQPPIGHVLARNADTDELFWVDPAELQHGAQIHGELAPELMEKLKSIFNKIKEHERSEPEFINDFMCDRDPANEIKIWNAIANTYQEWTTDVKFNERARHLIFTALVTASIHPNVDYVLSTAPNLKAVRNLDGLIRAYKRNLV